MAEAPESPAELKAALGYEHNFARVESVEEGRIALAYDLDGERWPWLALPPSHPVLIEKVQYFSAVTASWASGSMLPGTRSALTRLRWSCAPGVETYPVRGVSEPWKGERSLGYRLVLSDAAERELCVIEGEGFAFEDRDFEAWREESRQEARRAAGSAAIARGRDFVAAPREHEGRWVCAARVPTRGGFHPEHPYHTGTGDHVNAGHLIDCALQLARLRLGLASGAPLECRSGEARFKRFVELDVPFEIRLDSAEHGGDGTAVLESVFCQGGRENASVRLELGGGDML